MAVTVEITRQAFRLVIDLGDEAASIDQENINAVTNGTLSFMESRACRDEELPDGVEIAGQLHMAAEELEKNDVGWKVGKDYARWGDELFKDPAKRDQLVAIIEPLISSAVTAGGSLLKQALKAILCDHLGVVSEISIQRVASVFMLCWNLFKTALITYSIIKAFEVLGKILKTVILFLQDTQFFSKLRELGGWLHLHQLVSSYQPSLRSAVSTFVRYGTVATAAAIGGGIVVYCYLRWKSA